MKLKKLLLLVMIAALSVSVFACRNSDDSSSSQKPQEVLITLSENELNMRVGENKTVTANVTGSSATVEWVSSAPEVATVEGGVISAVSKGSAVITATVEEKSATVTVNVANTASLTLESDKLSVNAETWTDKDNTVYGKTTVSITPILTVNGTVTDGTFTYECADENVAEVDDNGVVTGKKIGTTAIEVSCVYDGETLKTTATVTVKKVDIASKEAFTFGGDKNEWVIDVTRFGLTADDVIAIYLEDGTDYVQTDDAGEIIYDGNSAKVITAGIDVDKKTEPDTVIIETEGLLISIKIAYVSANNVEFVSESSPMVIGAQKQLKLYAFGVEVSESAEWSVNKDYIATIDDEGVLTAVNYGTVKVTAKVYGYTYTTVQVVVKEESPKTAMEAVTVHNYTTGGDHYGYKQTTHGQYAAGDWVRFSFTPSEDFNGMLYVYYGLNNLEDKFEENFPNGCAFAFAGSKKFSGNIFTDSSFIVLDKDGIQVGSIAEKTGAGIYKKGETYTVYVQIPDDGSVDHDLFIKFASENHLVEEQVMRGVLSWRDNLDNASCAIEVKNISGYIYSGETRRNIYDVEGKLSFRGASLETENSIDVASLGINSEVITAYLKDASFEVILKDENGKPVITNGKLTVLNTFFTQCGTNGVKTLVLETEEDRYNVPFEIVPVDEKRNGAVALIPGLADYIFVDTAKMVSEINAGRQFLAFDVYSDGFGDNAYIYFQIGARHIYVKNNCAYIHSTWDSSRKDKITANFIRVIDEEGSLVYDTVTWGGSKMFGTKSDSMQPGKWYKVIIDMDGRAWDDATCMQYLSYSHAMATVVGMNAYFNNIKTYSTAEFEGIVLDCEEAVLAEGESLTLIATLSELLTGTKVIWTSSLEEVATVTQNGVVTAHKAGNATIIATVNGKSVRCEITVKPVIGIAEGSEKELTTAITTWLPGTFDKGAAGSNENVNPAYVPGEDFAGCNVLKVQLKIKEGAANGYLHIYEYAGTDNTKWTPGIVRWTVIGRDAYSTGRHYDWNFPAADFEHLLITDKNTGVTTYQKAVEWVPGHEYELLIAVGENNSIGFWYSSTLYATSGDNQGQGILANWNIPSYCLNVLDNIEFVKFYGGKNVAGEKTIKLDKTEATVNMGETLTLNATLSHEGTVEWESSDPEIATVENGVVTSVKGGEVVITAKAFGKEVNCVVTVLEMLTVKDGSEKELTTAITTWLPGTFDKGAAGSNTNVNPAYVPGEDFAGCNVLEAVIKIKEGATIGFLHINEYAGTDKAAWVPTVNKSIVIGKDYYGVDKRVTDNGSESLGSSYNKNSLVILDITDESNVITYADEAVEWTAGHTYKLLIKVAEGNSVGFWYSAQALVDGNGPLGIWNNPTYCLDVLANIEFVKFFGAIAK